MIPAEAAEAGCLWEELPSSSEAVEQALDSMVAPASQLPAPGQGLTEAAGHGQKVVAEAVELQGVQVQSPRAEPVEPVELGQGSLVEAALAQRPLAEPRVAPAMYQAQ
mmetsp:Transcript_66575/g.117719  ORF Transcript_66575/g.117719 Transcript_66575/m.117719 type:complete len:108 (+) Transcript_66575:160-483(+)